MKSMSDTQKAQLVDKLQAALLKVQSGSRGNEGLQACLDAFLAPDLPQEGRFLTDAERLLLVKGRVQWMAYCQVLGKWSDDEAASTWAKANAWDDKELVYRVIHEDGLYANSQNWQDVINATLILAKPEVLLLANDDTSIFEAHVENLDEVRTWVHAQQWKQSDPEAARQQAAAYDRAREAVRAYAAQQGITLKEKEDEDDGACHAPGY